MALRTDEPEPGLPIAWELEPSGVEIVPYSSLSRRPPRFAGGLAGQRLETVLEYVEATLAKPISLHRLAERPPDDGSWS